MSDYLISGIGKKLRAVRMERKIKLTALANKAGVSKGLLSKIENGRTVPSSRCF
ncbi:MAG: helix-turn-helix transcriptional regulator [Haliscomenobacter sp.]|nr:helix-turn-helix transcriptional regulator [Haliscomenobacter sp.]